MLLICLEKPVVKKPKDNPPTKPVVSVPTPLELSRLKAERDRALNQAILAERQAQVTQNYESINFLRLSDCKCRRARHQKFKKKSDDSGLPNSNKTPS